MRLLITTLIMVLISFNAFSYNELWDKKKCVDVFVEASNTYNEIENAFKKSDYKSADYFEERMFKYATIYQAFCKK